jgi:hypothetical protein
MPKNIVGMQRGREKEKEREKERAMALTNTLLGHPLPPRLPPLPMIPEARDPKKICYSSPGAEKVSSPPL